ncbi:MAG: hypothetical protein ACOC4J_05395, partial [Bacteroidota bacterium]
SKEFPWFSSLEGNTSYQADIFYNVGGWNDDIKFGHGGRELSLRIAGIEPDLRKQIYSPHPVIIHDYVTDRKHYQKKIARQKATLAKLLKIYPYWFDYFELWEKHKYRYDLIIPNKNQ